MTTEQQDEQQQKKRAQRRQLIVWTAALAIGALLGTLGQEWLNTLMNFIATVYTRLFKLLAVPTIALAVITTLAMFGRQKDTGRIFLRTILYTFTTTLAAALVGLLLYVVVAPGNLPAALVRQTADSMAQGVGQTTYYDHLLSVVPDNALRPLLEGNVLSVLLLAMAVGGALAYMPDSEGKRAVNHLFTGLQSLLFTMIRALIWTLPLGIVAFSAQLTAQLTAGMAIDSLGRYVLVVMGGNVLQMFLVLPLFLLARGINPVRAFRAMSPAVLMALFTKSSAATLPVTMASAEDRMGVSGKVARFVLPICTTINMNGCAAFILVTSLFVMQNGGIPLTWSTMLLWALISVVSAVGNAGVPMGCFFLTLSLMAGIGAPVGLLGIILPIYTIIDMVETAENVWSDSCVAAMTHRDISLHE